MTIIVNGKRYADFKYTTEKEFEDDVVDASKTLFGNNTIFVNAKKKIDNKSLGGTVPDGFFFDFGDPMDPQFYIVEVELSQHKFYEHVFPQITKFFAFFKNTKRQKALVDKLFTVINTDDALRSEFKKYLGHTEIYKFISDIIESSQNILLIADGTISALPEIMDTYTDTWGKMVLSLEVRKYVNDRDVVYSLTPDFETLQYAEASGEGIEGEELGPETERPNYSEEYHLDGVSSVPREIYAKIKGIASALDGSLVFNSQKYYISIRANKNIAFIKFRKKKVRFVVMMPEGEIRKCVSHYAVASLSASVQKFYNGPCAAVYLTNLNYLPELEILIKRLIEFNKSG